MPHHPPVFHLLTGDVLPVYPAVFALAFQTFSSDGPVLTQCDRRPEPGSFHGRYR